MGSAGSRGDLSASPGSVRRGGTAQDPAGRRLLVGLLVAVLVAGLWLAVSPRGLRPPIDIVGYPTFHDFDFHRQFLLYRVLAWELPLVTWFVVAVLRRVGPWRAPRRPPAPKAPRTTARPRAEVLPARGGGLRLLPTALLIGVAVDSGGVSASRGFSAAGIVAIVGYVVVVLAVGVARRRTGDGGHQRAGADWHVVAVVNGCAAPLVSLVALQRFASHTAVVHDGQVRQFGWLPWWVTAAVGLVVYLVALRLRLGGWSVKRLEWWAVTVLAGTVLVALAVSSLPKALAPIQGFDDMQSVTGADLLTRGYFPWRDFYFIHGVFEDALRSLAGFPVFGHSMWGSIAAGTVWWAPLYGLGCYLFTVWLAPDHWLFRLSVTTLIVWHAAHGISLRWSFVGLLALLLGQSMRRSGQGWMALFTASLFVAAVIVPETSFLVISCTIVIVLSEWWGRPVGARWRLSDFPRTTTYVGVGMLCLGIWIGFLALHRALPAFIDYYLIFGPGHAESGTQPLGPFSSNAGVATFVVVLLAVLTGFALLARRFLRRAQITYVHWTALALVLFSAFYNEKAIARFDDGHIQQTFTAGLPTLVAVLALLSSELTKPLSGTVTTGQWRSRLRERPVAGAGALLGVLLVAIVCGPSVAGVMWTLPEHNRQNVPDLAIENSRLGFSTSTTYQPEYVKTMERVLDVLAPHDGAVFDFTNSPGYFYFLMHRPLATRYYHVSMAIPEFAQRELVSELERSRPPVAVYDSENIGLPSWDGPRSEVRHFIVARYLLDHYRPVVSVQGTLFMLRNDLRADRGQLSDVLGGTESEASLIDDAPTCDWGESANFLSSSPKGPQLELPVTRSRTVRRVAARGWSYDTKARQPVRQIVIGVGDRAVLTLKPILVSLVGAALGMPNAGTSGFGGSTVTRFAGRANVYAVLADGKAHPIPSQGQRDLPRALRLPSGAELTVSQTPADGKVNTLSSDRQRMGTVELPAGIRAGQYSLAGFDRSQGRIGRADVVISDSARSRDGSSPLVSFDVLPVAGRGVSVRIGSCLRWRGREGDRLVIFQRGGRPIERLTLSGLR